MNGNIVSVTLPGSGLTDQSHHGQLDHPDSGGQPSAAGLPGRGDSFGSADRNRRDHGPGSAGARPGHHQQILYMWVFRGGDPDKPALIYQYHPTRAGDVAADFINGYKGYVQTDGYAGYGGLDYKPGLIHICLLGT